MDLMKIQPNAEVIGADGVHVGTVDHVEDGHLKLSRRDSSDGRHHFVDGSLIAEIEDGKVRLSANASVAFRLEEVGARTDGERLDEALEETFPASDPVSAKHIT